MNLLKRISHWKLIAAFLVVWDFFAIHLAYFLALWVRFDCRFSAIPGEIWREYYLFVPIWAICSIVLFEFFRLYRMVWRYASYSELIRTVLGSLLSSLLHSLLITVLLGRMPLSYYLWGGILQVILMCVSRFSYRLLLFFHSLAHGPGDSRVMIVGAGQAGQLLLRDIRIAKEVRDQVVCFIDDNRNKWGRFVEGVPVAGGREDILRSVQTYQVDKIYFAIPSASPAAS